MSEFEATGKNWDEKKEEESECKQAGDYRNGANTPASTRLKPAGSSICKK